MTYPTLPQRFLDAVDRRPTSRAQIYKKDGRWDAISSAEVLRRVAGLSSALVELGVKPGDRVGLFAANRPEWHIADFAILGAGAINVPVYFNESCDRLAYILNHSGAKVVFAAGAKQTERLISCRDRLKSAEHFILADASGELAGEYLRYETLLATTGELDTAFYRRRASEVLPGQVATIIYTSGTTGEPKGVMLTHINLSSNATDSVNENDLYPASDVALSFLPLSHVYERMLDYVYLFSGLPLAYVDSMDGVPSALTEVRPTVLAAVPRFFEKIYARLLEQGRQVKGFKRRIFDWSLDVAQRAVPWRAHGEDAPVALRVAWAVADRLVYSKLRRGMGGRLRVVFSGGAPLARELAEFFCAVGVTIYQGYGLTETSPIVSSNYPANRVGSVGRPIRNVQVSIADDGEVLVKGPCVMQGYYLRPDATREAFAPDGWFRTGDVGRLDNDGYLYITDRKKDLLKTAAGKFVAPQPIENTLKTSPYILNAAVLGDKRKFIVALIVPHFANVADKARETGLWFHTNAELAAHPFVHELLEQEIRRLTAHLAQYETIKRFAVLEDDFTFDDGSLTYTMKLKRRVIAERYSEIIDRLYADVEEPRSLAQS